MCMKGNEKTKSFAVPFFLEVSRISEEILDVHYDCVILIEQHLFMESFFSITGPVQCGLNALASYMTANSITLDASETDVKLTVEEHALPPEKKSAVIQKKLIEVKKTELPGHKQYEMVKQFLTNLSSDREYKKPYVLHLFVSCFMLNAQNKRVKYKKYP